MIISHKYKFIFFKPHKVASTSVMFALSSSCGDNDTSGAPIGADLPNWVEGKGLRNVSLFKHLGSGDNPNHAYPADIKEITDFVWGPWIWNEYRKFTIVRNPWDRVVSSWDYQSNNLGKQWDLGAAVPNRDRPYYFWPDGSLTADSYLRYESLDEEFCSLCRELGLPAGKLPKLRAGSRNDPNYRHYYTPDLRDAVAESYDLEISQFGYQF